jgi:hypothetical protein
VRAGRLVRGVNGLAGGRRLRSGRSWRIGRFRRSWAQVRPGTRSVAKACGKAVVAQVGIQATALSGVGVGEIRAKVNERCV